MLKTQLHLLSFLTIISLHAAQDAHIATNTEKEARATSAPPSTPSHNAPLHRALLDHNLKKSQLLLKKTSTNLNAQNKKGLTPLHIAITHGMYSFFEELIKKDISYTLCDLKGNTPLHTAAQQEDIRFLKVLLEKDASHINTQNADGDTPLHLATRANNVIAADLLLGHHAYYDIKNNNLETAYLIAQDAPEIITPSGMEFTSMQELFHPDTMLWSHYIPIIDLLKKSTLSEDDMASLHTQAIHLQNTTPNKSSVLHYLVTNKGNFLDPKERKQLISQLIAYKIVDINYQDTNGNTALHEAILNNLSETAKFLVQNEALTSLENAQKETPVSLLLKLIAILQKEIKSINVPATATTLEKKILEEKIQFLRSHEARLIELKALMTPESTPSLFHHFKNLIEPNQNKRKFEMSYFIPTEDTSKRIRITRVINP